MYSRVRDHVTEHSALRSARRCCVFTQRITQYVSKENRRLALHHTCPSHRRRQINHANRSNMGFLVTAKMWKWSRSPVHYSITMRLTAWCRWDHFISKEASNLLPCHYWALEIMQSLPGTSSHCMNIFKLVYQKCEGSQIFFCSGSFRTFSPLACRDRAALVISTHCINNLCFQ